MGFVGDTNGDGFDDFVLGADQFAFTSGTGYAALISGFDASLLGGYLGDDNGDGRPDLLLGGSRFDFTTGIDSGVAKLFVSVERYPGSEDDLVIKTSLDRPLGTGGRRIATGGELLQVEVSSPQGTFDFSPYLLAAQMFVTGTPISQPLGFAALLFVLPGDSPCKSIPSRSPSGMLVNVLDSK